MTSFRARSARSDTGTFTKTIELLALSRRCDNTNALLVTEVFKDAINEKMDLDAIEVEQSPISQPDSDYWDVKLIFFDPEKRLEEARKVHRFRVDVSDIVPVMVGDVRS